MPTSPLSDGSTRLPLLVIGAGLMGRQHIVRILSHPQVRIAGIADPAPSARDYATSVGVRWYADHRDALLVDEDRGVAAIVATPNATHGDVAIDCLRAGLPVLVEKPVSGDLADGVRLCAEARRLNLPVLVGHQRRHNPIVMRARAMIASGAIGKPVVVNVMANWLKPNSYFDTSWRRQPGAGPILINLIHDIDLLRHLVGEIAQVTAMSSNATRGFEVEDTAVAVLRFTNGALATVSVSDCAATPWNYDLGSREAQMYAAIDADAHYIGGTDGSLTLPRLLHYRYRDRAGWYEPLSCERTPVHHADPFVVQLTHLRAVVEGREPPLCSAADGLRSLQAALAVSESARSGEPITLKE